MVVLQRSRPLAKGADFRLGPWVDRVPFTQTGSKVGRKERKRQATKTKLARALLSSRPQPWPMKT